MIIHVVQPGETLQSIADLYQISYERLMLENDITTPNCLVVGQTIVILYPNETYTVKEGDTLESIANSFDVTVNTILRNNNYLVGRELVPGEEIVISYMDKKNYQIIMNGFAYDFINLNVLKKTLPYLTYLTIFQYQLNADGSLIPINDKAIIDLAKAHGVSPIMLVTPFTSKGVLDISIVHTILADPVKQDRLLNSIIDTLKEKGYDGVNIDMQYIIPQDDDAFVAFMERLVTTVHNEGYFITYNISPSVFELNTGTIYPNPYYKTLGEIMDGITVIYYDWCCVRGYPRGLATFESLANYVESITSIIPSERITLGITAIGYIWQIPFIEGVSMAHSISNPSAVKLASITDSTILFNVSTLNPYFNYTYFNEYTVWFRDANSIYYNSSLVPRLSLHGITMWNIMQFFTQAWLILNHQFDIIKLYDEKNISGSTSPDQKN